MQATIGSISSATMRPEDLIPTFADELESLTSGTGFGAGEYQSLIDDARAIEDFDNDEAYDVLSDLFDALDAFAPDYCYFGAHPGDGADYGFWPIEDFQQRMEDDGVLIVSDLSEVPEDFDGPALAVINDHGNVTYYARDERGEYRERWSTV